MCILQEASHEHPTAQLPDLEDLLCILDTSSTCLLLLGFPLTQSLLRVCQWERWLNPSYALQPWALTSRSCQPSFPRDHIVSVIFSLPGQQVPAFADTSSGAGTPGTLKPHPLSHSLWRRYSWRFQTLFPCSPFLAHGARISWLDMGSSWSRSHSVKPVSSEREVNSHCDILRTLRPLLLTLVQKSKNEVVRTK